jgi:drug/metabolite transporter (DMT)-like permease
MLTGACFFSAMAILTQQLADSLSWQVIALVRTMVAFFIAAGMTYFGGARFVCLRPRTLWIRSIAGSCSLLLTFFALTHTQSLSQVLVLSNMFPVWVAVLSWPVLGVLPKWDAWAAIACGITGVIVIQQPSIAQGDYALLAAALGSFTTSIAMLGLHRLQHLDPRSIVTHFSLVSVLFCLAALLLLPHTHSSSSLDDPLTLATLLGVGGTATVGQLFLTKAFAAGSPAKVSVVMLSQIGITAAYDVWNDQILTAATLVGMALIIAPTVWLLLRANRRDVLEKEHVPPPVE